MTSSQKARHITAQFHRVTHCTPFLHLRDCELLARTLVLLKLFLLRIDLGLTLAQRTSGHDIHPERFQLVLVIPTEQAGHLRKLICPGPSCHTTQSLPFRLVGGRVDLMLWHSRHSKWFIQGPACLISLTHLPQRTTHQEKGCELEGRIFKNAAIHLAQWWWKLESQKASFVHEAGCQSTWQRIFKGRRTHSQTSPHTCQRRPSPALPAGAAKGELLAHQEQVKGSTQMFPLKRLLLQPHLVVWGLWGSTDWRRRVLLGFLFLHFLSFSFLRWGCLHWLAFLFRSSLRLLRRLLLWPPPH